MHPGAQERWRLRLEDAEAAAQAKLDRARDLISQYEDPITELSQDSSSLTASAQALRDDNSALSAGLEVARADAEHLQALPLTPPGLHLRGFCTNFACPVRADAYKQDLVVFRPPMLALL